MAFGEGKYTNLKADGLTLIDDEPYFVLRAKDLLAPAAVLAYAEILNSAAYGVLGVPTAAMNDSEAWQREQQAGILQAGRKAVKELAVKMRMWQASHTELCQLPD